MKFILCRKCSDVIKFAPPVHQHSECTCGNVAAMYYNELHALYHVKDLAVTDRGVQSYELLGINNHSLVKALNVIDKSRTVGEDALLLGPGFEAFLIVEPCDTIKRVDVREKLKEVALVAFRYCSIEEKEAEIEKIIG